MPQKPDIDSSIDDAASEWIGRRDAGLSAPEQAEFERWLSADARHADALERFRAAWSAYDKPRRVGGADAVIAELASRAWRRRVRALSAGMAACAILVVGSVLMRSRPSSAAGLTPTGAVILAPTRQVLLDGSTVELKASSEIVPEFATDARRVVLRQGEALFAVAQDASRPFIVKAGGVEIRALGTSFSVQLGASQVSVLVTEGRVSVDRPALVASSRRLDIGEKALATPAIALGIVEAGNRLVVDWVAAGDAPVVAASSVSLDEVSERLSWRHPRVEFSGTHLTDAVALMNERKGSGRRLVLADAALSSMRVSGLFRADNIDDFVDLLEASFGIKADRFAERIELRKAR